MVIVDITLYPFTVYRTTVLPVHRHSFLKLSTGLINAALMV